MHNQFIALLNALSLHTGYTHQPDQGEACTLLFDDISVTLQYLEGSGSLLIYCAIGTIPAGNTERLALYTHLLEANFFFRKTLGATLAVDESTGLVSLQQTLRLQGLEEVHFLSLLESYLHTAEHWKGICASGPAIKPAEAQPAACTDLFSRV